MENLTQETNKIEVIGLKNYCPPNWGFLIFMYGIIFILPFIILRYKPSGDNLILLDREKRTIFLDQKKRTIALEEIDRIIFKHRSPDIARPEPHGKIIIRTKDGKKYKQKHLANVFGVAEKIVEEAVKLGLELPKIICSISGLPIEKEQQLEFYRNHMKTGEWG